MVRPLPIPGEFGHFLLAKFRALLQLPIEGLGLTCSIVEIIDEYGANTAR